ncbi:helix-turn-helix domain-containing protein [Spirosoma sp. HMF4905]|uniref:Helix-turn-helix domain-containing protein n=1 Tax=Spirosoma arboris TaxID=2682092 RepID=A0A7K1SMH5_9BACT|nr:recombinase family protein [Spirosoma arboris]MVM34995.1 helix-turn-helix domain-containing protein [Spirosoma arboris]
MIFGYGRVSTRDQNLNLQEDALTQAGCEQIFMEKITGTKKNRPELNKLRAKLRAGDTVVVWKLDRWGRSLSDLIELMNELREKQVQFKCLAVSMDTSTIEGRLIYGIFSVLSEFVRDTIVENTNAGLSAARARGRTGGRKPGLSKEADIKASAAKTLYQSGNTGNKICKMLGIGSKRTLYKYLRAKGVKIGEDIAQEVTSN